MDSEYLYKFQSQKQPPLLTTGESSSNVGDAYINGVYTDLSFRSLLTYGSSHPVHHNYHFEQLADQYPLQSMKSEPLFKINDTESSQTYSPPYSFFTEAPTSPPSLKHWQMVPNLLSLQPPQQNTAAVTTAESLLLYPKLEIVKQTQRRKRQKLSDRTRILQKLLPQDKKMDMATVLEESYKYIKFLQAQVRVLQSMPRVTIDGYNGISSAENGNFGGVIGDLLRLNRQELLQVVVNTPAAQTMLYSKECCVYSLEQLVSLKNNNSQWKAAMLLMNTESNL